MLLLTKTQADATPVVAQTKKAPTTYDNNKTVHQAVSESVSNEDDESSVSTISIIIAIGGGTAFGAAGVDLVFMKNNNSNQYEDLKQKKS